MASTSMHPKDGSHIAEKMRRHLRPSESIIGSILFFCAIVSIFTTIGIVITLGAESFRLFSKEQCVEVTYLSTGKRCEEVTLNEFLTTTEWVPQSLKFGALPLIASTLTTSFIAMTIAIPLGIGAAIYLSEYASPRTRRVLKPILEVLAGIPTVVYGFFALTFVTPVLRDVFTVTAMPTLFNMLSAGLVMGIMILPLMASMSEDALNAVPRSLREGSFGLGANKLETTVSVVLPAALSGVIAAMIISVSRAVGETMIVAIAAGAGPRYTIVPFDAAETITGHIARISSGDISFNSVDYNSVFALGLMLFIVTLFLNIIGRQLATIFREEYD
ncbi:MAG: phosphate ABC transporter permease subunit PstC [Phototrophicales bacterium]|nr:MAG: phosphate ABC transporter permease subunit PstC [Phototrophicales bacterium]